MVVVDLGSSQALRAIQDADSGSTQSRHFAQARKVRRNADACASQYGMTGRASVEHVGTETQQSMRGKSWDDQRTHRPRSFDVGAVTTIR